MPYHVTKSSSCPASKPYAVVKNADGKVMGCHASESDANDQLAALYANEGDQVTTPISLAAPQVTGGAYEDFAQMQGEPWTGVLAVEGVETGDGREFSPNSLTWTGEPMALRWNKIDSHGGVPQTQAVNVGRIDQVYRDPAQPNFIMGKGVFDMQSPDGAEAYRLVKDGFLSGVSIDSDNIKDADVELVFPESNGSEDDPEAGLFDLFMEPDKVIFHAGRIRAATLTDIPAFTQARIWLDSQMPGPTGSAGPMASHFNEISDADWTGSVYETRLRLAGNVERARSAFAHVHTGDDGFKARFLHHEVDDNGDVTVANLNACIAGIRALNAGNAETMSNIEQLAAYNHLALHLRQAGLDPGPFTRAYTSVTAAAYDDLVKPPAEWFTDPELDKLTPLTITDEGRVFGHGAAWGTCHTAFPGACTTPPVEGQHSYYRVGEVVTADGSRVAVGTITLGTGHASVRGLTPMQAAEHYDNTGTVVAVVASGEDKYGIWVAGAVRPGTSESRIAELRASALSGDWRRIGGQLRLVAFLAVNRPGFPVPRTAMWVNKQQQSLVAAGVVTPHVIDYRAEYYSMKRNELRKRVGRDPETLIAALRERMGR